MKTLILTIGFVLLTSCVGQPTKLSDKVETIEVSYVNWSCDCADFIEVKYFNDNPNYETNENDCIFIEPSNIEKKVPEDFYNKGHFEYYLKLRGQFYLDKGIPKSYERKTPEGPLQKAKVFRYDSFELIKKNKNTP